MKIIYTKKQYKKSIELKKQGLGSLKISKILGIKNRNVIEGWINKDRKPLCIKKKYIISHDDLIKNINKVKNKNLGDLSHIIGLINGDGHLQIKKDGSGVVSFYSKHIKEIINVNKKFQKLFGIKGKVYIDNSYNRKRYKLFFMSSELARFLESVGVVKGKKTEKEYLIPKWILKGNKQIKSGFLRGIFSTEGFILKSIENNKIRYRGGISQYKDEKIMENCKEYLEQIKRLVEEFGITCSNVHYGGKGSNRNTQGFKFTFEKKSFDKFYNYIGFNNEKKNLRLIEALSSKNKTF